MTKTKTVKTALAAVTLAAATFALPATASAQNSYRNANCSDTQNAVLGGVVGGSLGTVIGEEIAGRGDKTEGAILGAIIGGIAGAAIGDGANDCEKTQYRTNQVRYPTTTTYGNRNARIQTVRHDTHYGQNRGYNRNVRVDPLYRINREIEQTRREGDRLKRELKYSRGYNRGLRRAVEANGYRLDQLKRERRQIKKYGTARNTYYSNNRGY